MNGLSARIWHSPTLTTWGSLGVRLGTALLVLPVVLVSFAPAEVALWQLYTTLYLLALMLDFGMAPTLARMLAFARGGAAVADMADMRVGGPGQGYRQDSAQAVMGTLRWLYPRAALVLVAVMAALGTWALVVPVSQAQDPRAAWLAWAVVLSTTGIGLWGGAFGAALQGMDRVAVLRRWEVAVGLCQLLSSVLVLALGGDLLALVTAFFAWVPVSAIGQRVLLQRLQPELFAGAAVRSPEVLRVMWPPTWRSGVGVVMSHGLLHLSGVIYSQVAPAADAAAYLVALRVMTLISQFCQAPFYSKLPRLAELQAAGRQLEQLRLAQRGMRMAHWVFVAGALLVALAAEPLLQAIGSQTAFVAPGVWALLALAFFAERLGAMHLQLYSLTNHIVWHIANGVTGLLMVALALSLYTLLGTYCFPTAMLLAYVGFYCTYSISHSRRAFGLQVWRFESATAVPAAAMLVGGLALALWTQGASLLHHTPLLLAR